MYNCLKTNKFAKLHDAGMRLRRFVIAFAHHHTAEHKIIIKHIIMSNIKYVYSKSW